MKPMAWMSRHTAISGFFPLAGMLDMISLRHLKATVRLQD